MQHHVGQLQNLKSLKREEIGIAGSRSYQVDPTAHEISPFRPRFLIVWLRTHPDSPMNVRAACDDPNQVGCSKLSRGLSQPPPPIPSIPPQPQPPVHA